MFSGLLHVLVELGSLYETSNHVLYLIHSGRLFWLTITKYSYFITRLQSGLNLQPPDDCLFKGLGNHRL